MQETTVLRIFPMDYLCIHCFQEQRPLLLLLGEIVICFRINNRSYTVEPYIVLVEKYGSFVFFWFFLFLIFFSPEAGEPASGLLFLFRNVLGFRLLQLRRPFFPEKAYEINHKQI